MKVGRVEWMRGNRWWWVCFRAVHDGPGRGHTTIQGPPWKVVRSLVYVLRRNRKWRQAA